MLRQQQAGQQKSSARCTADHSGVAVVGMLLAVLQWLERRLVFVNGERAECSSQVEGGAQGGTRGMLVLLLLDDRLKQGSKSGEAGLTIVHRSTTCLRGNNERIASEAPRAHLLLQVACQMATVTPPMTLHQWSRDRGTW